MQQLTTFVDSFINIVFFYTKRTPIVLFSVFFLLILSDVKAFPQQCYKCTSVIPTFYTNETIRLCSKFQKTNTFITTCPYSTMCMKKVYQYPLLSGELITLEERGCADQKYDFQEPEGKQWKMKTRVEELYTEGCEISNDKGLRSSKTEYCYCRDHLCNSALPTQPQTYLPYHTDTVAVIIVFNLIKYIQSL